MRHVVVDIFRNIARLVVAFCLTIPSLPLPPPSPLLAPPSQPLVAIPAYMAADSFDQFLPLCMGFAAGCMIWIVFGEILPECLKEGADASQVATAATVSVALMEGVGTFLEAFETDAG